MGKYDWLDGYLMAMTGCAKDYKEEWGWQRYQVGGRLFAAVCHPGEKYRDYGGRELLTIKCEPLMGELMRSEYPDILPGFYMDKLCWISVDLNGEVPEDVLRMLCGRSYALVFEKLTRKLRCEIAQSAEKT